MNRLLISLILLLASTLCCAADAPGQGGLTPIGAEQAGNNAGTIPPWKGGLTAPPASYQEGKHETSPFPDDKPLFQINAANAAQYSANLSP